MDTANLGHVHKVYLIVVVVIFVVIIVVVIVVVGVSVPAAITDYY